MNDHQRGPDWDPRADDVLHDQIKAYDAMRKSCPVAWSDFQHWSLFRHADCVRVLEDHNTFSSVVSAHPSVPNGFDPPEHTAFRKIVEPYFSAPAMNRFEPICRDIARRLVDSLPDDEPFDVVGRFSNIYALRIQCAFMGWPDSLHEPLRRWVRQNHRATLAQDRGAMADIARQFDGYVHELLESRRQSDRPSAHDVTNSLMAEIVDGRPMTDTELTSLLRNWTVGEVGTISASVSILLNFLASYPAHLQSLVADPERLPDAIEEILRMDAPLISNRRVARRDVVIGEREVLAGEKVTILWASANRDEDVFGDPDAFRPEKNHDKNLLYGAGVHVCPGAPLARLELKVLMETLLAAVEVIEHAQGQQSVRAAFPAGGFDRLSLVVKKRSSCW